MATKKPNKPQLALGYKMVLRVIARYRFITLNQLRAALGVMSYAQAKTMLFDLFRHGFVERLIVTKASRRINFIQVFALSRHGAGQLVLESGLNRIFYIKASDKRSTMFLEHTILINDFRICLENAERATKAFHLESWKQTRQEVKVAINQTL